MTTINFVIWNQGKPNTPSLTAQWPSVPQPGEMVTLKGDKTREVVRRDWNGDGSVDVWLDLQDCVLTQDLELQK